MMETDTGDAMHPLISSFANDVNDMDGLTTLFHPFCPCQNASISLPPSHRHYHQIKRNRRMSLLHRFLNDETTDDDEDDNKVWEIAYTAAVLCLMFGALMSDRFGADSIMFTALTAFLVVEIISIPEGLEGFANEGLWAVMILFVVAEGIGKTGALDWYMSKLLGHPSSLASAQLRLMIPIAVVSAFLNNTPVVVVMIPIVQRWAKNIRQSAQQLLIPLSFASILGGTCTLIGTSTNLVVTGLLEERYDGEESITIGLFDLGQYGIPVAMAGLAYILVASPFLLPGSQELADAAAEADELLLGARLTQWSPAVNRTVQRSGLRDTGGIYLVSVHRAATGNVHRAVSKDFVLNVGDILYFTGHSVENFGDFCAENGLEVVTNEIATQHEPLAVNGQQPHSPDHDSKSTGQPAPLSTIALVKDAAANNGNSSGGDDPHIAGHINGGGHLSSVDLNNHHHNLNVIPWQTQTSLELEPILEDEDHHKVTDTVGCSKESLLMADYDELIRNINRMQDIIRNTNTSATDALTTTSTTSTTTTGNTIVGPGGRSSNLHTKRVGVGRPTPPQQVTTVDGLRPTDPPKIIVTVEKDLVVVGINARDRAGLLLDISKGLLRLDLQLHHTEAAVLTGRSVSIWRCQVIGHDLPDVEEIWSVLNALLSSETGVEAIKKRGLRVIRATVVKGSRLIGKTATEVNFRTVYKTAIVAVRQQGANVPPANLSTVRLNAGDILILQASDDSPLLQRPPPNFYKELEESLAEQERTSVHSSSQHHPGGGGTGGNGGGALSSRGSSSMQSLVNLIRRRSSGNLSSSLPPTSDEDEEMALPGSYRTSSNHALPTTTTAGPDVGDSADGAARRRNTANSYSPPPTENEADEDGEIFLLGEDNQPVDLDEENIVEQTPAEMKPKERTSIGDREDTIETETQLDEMPPPSSDEPPVVTTIGDESLDAALFRQEKQEAVWKDLMVYFKNKSSSDSSNEEDGVGDGGGGGGGGVASREFLTAMAIAPGSKFVGKTVAQAGIHKLPELFLVSIERPRERVEGQEDSFHYNPHAINLDNHTKRQRRRQKFQQLLHPRRALHHPHPAIPQQQPHLQQSPSSYDEDHPNSDVMSVRTDQVAYEAIDPDEPLKEGDVLWFSGSASAVGDLRKIPGMVQYQSEEVEKINERVHDRRLVQAVIARNGPLVGRTVKELQFRTRFGAAVIAVHREGTRVHEHPGRIKLQAGDVLLLEAGPSFLGRSVENDRAFALLAEVKDSAPPRLDLLIPALSIAVAMLAVFTAGVTSILICALVASVLMVALGILSEREARDALKWDIFITIACAFGIGNALVNSGVAGGIANLLVSIGEAVGMGDAGLLGAVYFATFLISNVVTNNAAAALLFPIAMDAAEQTGVDRVIMSYALMLGASASFMSPFGYTTNLLIYGPGGYKYNDFLRFGTPMQVLLWILTTAFLVVEQWYISWIAMFVILVLVAFLRIATRSSSSSSSKATTNTAATSSSSPPSGTDTPQ